MDVADKPPPPRSAFGLSMAELRESVAAPMKPDEGMRGTMADKIKLSAAADAEILRAVAAALRGRSSEAADAAAVVRSLAITAEAAVSVCNEGVLPSLLMALRRRLDQQDPTLAAWGLAAISRLAQHRETHRRLLQVGAVQTLSQYTHRTGALKASTVRTDIIASLCLAFLSESAGPTAASEVPLRMVPLFGALLTRRLETEDPIQVVERKDFCGMPCDYRPRFIAQALALLFEASAAHAAVAWETDVPEVVCGLLHGSLPNDTDQNLPWGSPDVVEMANRCRAALIARGSSRGGGAAPPEKVQALRNAPGAPKGTWAKRGGGQAPVQRPARRSRL